MAREKSDPKMLEELRVAQVELSSGDTSGKVYMQSTPGSVMFLTDRDVAQDKVASQIKELVNKELPFSSSKPDRRKT